MAYDNYWNEQNMAYQQDRDKVADQQWQAQFDEAKRQYDEQMALSKSGGSGGGSGGSGGGGDDGDGGAAYDNGKVSEENIKKIQKEAE